MEAERRRSGSGRPEHSGDVAPPAGARLSASNLEKLESAAAAEDARAQRRSDPKARTRAWLGSAELAPDPSAGKPACAGGWAALGGVRNGRQAKGATRKLALRSWNPACTKRCPSWARRGLLRGAPRRACVC